MKCLITWCLLAATLMPVGLPAQIDSLRLVCPLNEAERVLPAKNVIHYDLPDLSAILVSFSDTIVKAVYNGRVTNIELSEEGEKGLVLYARINRTDYYFWYSGFSKLSARRNETITAGQPLGIILPGQKIELLMFRVETPLDITKFLDCKCLVNTGTKLTEL